MDYSIISKHRGKLMGAAALWIYIFHILPAPAYGAAQGREVLWWYFRNAGFCGVDMFLLLSGLGLGYHMAKHPVGGIGDYGRFLVQRFSRIYWVFLPFALIYAVLDGWGIGLFLSRIVCWDQFAGNLYNFCWYVCCILVMYLLAPLAYGLLRRAGNWSLAALAGFCGVYVLGLIWAKGFIRSDLYAILARLPVFLLGLQTAAYSMDRRRITAWGWITAAALLIGGVFSTFVLNAGLVPSFMPSGNALANVLLAPALVLLLAAVFEGLERFPLFSCVGKVPAFFGGISFEFYLMQEWYVRRGKLALPAQGLIGHVGVFAVMTLLAAALHRLSGLLQKLPGKMKK